MPAGQNPTDQSETPVKSQLEVNVSSSSHQSPTDALYWPNSSAYTLDAASGFNTQSYDDYKNPIDASGMYTLSGEGSYTDATAV
jgi:hypothetical protein